MKNSLIVMLVISFLAVALFGIFGWHTEMAGHSAGCLAATVQGAACPGEGRPFEYLAFHLSAFRNFSTAPLNTPLFAIQFLPLLLLVIFFGLPWLNLVPPKRPSSPRRLEQWFLLPCLAQLKFIRWLALNENSPNFV